MKSVIVSVLMLGACACSSTSASPTTPTGPVPQIESVVPSTPVEKDGPQRVTIHAAGFDATTILYATSPGGSVEAFTGSTIQHLAVDYEVFMTLSEVGSYVLSARNGAGAASQPFTLPVQERLKPSIASITPTSVTVSDVPQAIGITGAGFEAGITATLVNGFDATVVGADAITDLTSTTFSLHFAFKKTGHYAINLVNLAGDVSNTVGVDASAASVK